MSRDFIVNGPCMVLVQGGAHFGLISDGPSIFDRTELGLCSEGVRISPRLRHRDIYVDDFGSACPVEVLWDGAEVEIYTPLVHYDRAVLSLCVQEATASRVTAVNNEGTIGSVGTPLGNGYPVLSSGNYYIQLSLTSPTLRVPWTFAACYVNGQPLEIPIGTKNTMAVVHWRSVPYQPLVLYSGGRVLGGPNTPPAPTANEMVSRRTSLYNNTPDPLPESPEEEEEEP